VPTINNMKSQQIKYVTKINTVTKDNNKQSKIMFLLVLTIAKHGVDCALKYTED